MARELLSSVSLILPEGCGMLIWRHLIFSGARVIGQMELRSLYMQAHLGHFPSDFIGTDVGAFEFLREGLELKKEWDKRPKAKRVAYEVPPWEISLSIFNGADSVEVMDKREALDKREASGMDKREASGMDKRAAKMVLVECPNGKLCKYSRIYLQEELIGFVTSAGYSFADGKCIGIGSVVCDGSFAATVKNPIGQSKQVFLRAI
jgi:glycine cleavage system aminomethyltransferase T